MSQQSEFNDRMMLELHEVGIEPKPEVLVAIRYAVEEFKRFERLVERYSAIRSLPICHGLCICATKVMQDMDVSLEEGVVLLEGFGSKVKRFLLSDVASFERYQEVA